MQLAICRYEALIKGFLSHVFVPNSASDRERSNKKKFTDVFAPLLRFSLSSLSLSLSLFFDGENTQLY